MSAECLVENRERQEEERSLKFEIKEKDFNREKGEKARNTVD